MPGIEPGSCAWKAPALPLSYIRIDFFPLYFLPYDKTLVSAARFERAISSSQARRINQTFLRPGEGSSIRLREFGPAWNLEVQHHLAPRLPCRGLAPQSLITYQGFLRRWVCVSMAPTTNVRMTVAMNIAASVFGAFPWARTTISRASVSHSTC